MKLFHCYQDYIRKTRCLGEIEQGKLLTFPSPFDIANLCVIDGILEVITSFRQTFFNLQLWWFLLLAHPLGMLWATLWLVLCKCTVWYNWICLKPVLMPLTMCIVSDSAEVAGAGSSATSWTAAAEHRSANTAAPARRGEQISPKWTSSASTCSTTAYPADSAHSASVSTGSGTCWTSSVSPSTG